VKRRSFPSLSLHEFDTRFAQKAFAAQ
jgi:hypothetical protein